MKDFKPGDLVLYTGKRPVKHKILSIKPTSLGVYHHDGLGRSTSFYRCGISNDESLYYWLDERDLEGVFSV